MMELCLEPKLCQKQKPLNELAENLILYANQRTFALCVHSRIHTTSTAQETAK